MINYMDRQTLANVAVRICDEFTLSQEKYGNLEMVFGWGVRWRRRAYLVREVTLSLNCPAHLFETRRFRPCATSPYSANSP